MASTSRSAASMSALQLDHLGGFLREIFLPVVAVLYRNFNLESLFHFDAEGAEIERPEVVEPIRKFFSLSRGKVFEYAMTR